MVIKSSKNKKPHFVSEARILRQYERSKHVTCHVLLPLGNDNSNILYNLTKKYDIYHVLTNKYERPSFKEYHISHIPT